LQNLQHYLQVLMNETRGAKVGKGIGLSPELWERVNEEARVYRRSRSWVIEERLRDSFGMRADLRNPQRLPKISQRDSIELED